MGKLLVTNLLIFALCMLGACAAHSGFHKNSIPGQLQLGSEQDTTASKQADAYFVRGGLAYEAQNYDEAEIQLRKAAELGHYKAQFILGTMYEDGKSVSQSNELATEWYRKSAAQGYAKAKARLRILSKKQ